MGDGGSKSSGGGGLKLNYGAGWRGAVDVNFCKHRWGLQVILMFKWYVIYSN